MTQGSDDPVVLRQQLVDLQTRLAFQDDAVRQLDDALVLHAALLDTLQRRVERLEAQIRQLRDDRVPPLDPQMENPPHY